MNIRISQPVAAAVALAAAAEAHSVDLTTIDTNNILFISGSTSIDNGIIQRFVNTTDGLCGGSIDTYSDTNPGLKFVAVACLSGSHATILGIALNTAIAFIKEDNAGSLNGITPVNNNAAIAFPALSVPVDRTANTTNCGATSPHICNTAVTVDSRAPNLGFSDVEAELFGVPTFQNDVVFSGNGVGDVLSCLQAHDSVGHFAIGLVNTETFWGRSR